MTTLKKKIKEHQKVLNLVIEQSKEIDAIINLLFEKIKSGGKILFCGNGGSCSDAQHLAAEMLIRLKPQNNRSPLAALSLATDTSTLTACGNDYNFSKIFSRPFEALSKENDILFIISTSGNSKNILNVLKSAKKKNITSVGFLGKGGGASKKSCDYKLIIKSNNTAIIQECHIFLGHYIIEKIEKKLIKEKVIEKKTNENKN